MQTIKMLIEALPFACTKDIIGKSGIERAKLYYLLEVGYFTMAIVH
jgi:hypothetical protein